jgi:hypothetical protein
MRKGEFEKLFKDSCKNGIPFMDGWSVAVKVKPIFVQT